MAFSEHCWKAILWIMDYWLLICLFVPHMPMLELESGCCAQHALYSMHLQMHAILNILYDWNSNSMFQKALISDHIFEVHKNSIWHSADSSRIHHQTLLAFFRKTQVSESLFQEKRGGRYLLLLVLDQILSLQEELVVVLPLTCAATHGKSQENSDSIGWPRSREAKRRQI